MAMQPLPFSLGVVVIIVVSMVQLAFVDPALLLIGAGPVPEPGPAQPLLHPAGRAARRPRPGPGRRRVGGGPRELRGRAGREDPRPRATGRSPGSRHAAEELRRARLVVGRLRAGFEPGLDALPNLGTVAAALARGLAGVDRRPHHRRAGAGDGPVRHPRLPVPDRGLPPRGAAPGRRGPRPDRRASSAAPSDAGPTDAAPPPRRPARRRPRRRALRATATTSCSTASRPASHRARSSRSSARPAAGKTTLCTLLAHLVDPTDGEIRLGGVPLDAADPDQLRAAVVAGVPGDLPVRRHRPGEPHPRRRARRRRGAGAPSRWPGPAPSSSASPTGSTR